MKINIFLFIFKKKYEKTLDLFDVNSESDETEEKRNYLLVYVPTSIVLISKFSYLNILKECISSIYDSILEQPENFRSILENFTFHLSHLPVPPLSFNRFSLILVIIP